MTTKLDKLKARLAEAEGVENEIRRKANESDGKAFDTLAEQLVSAESRTRLLQGSVNEAEAQAVAAAKAREQRKHKKERQAAIDALQDRKAAAEAEWLVWGEAMTRIDGELRELWAEFARLQAEAGAINREGRDLDVEISVVVPEVASTISNVVTTGRSPIEGRNWRTAAMRERRVL